MRLYLARFLVISLYRSGQIRGLGSGSRCSVPALIATVRLSNYNHAAYMIDKLLTGLGPAMSLLHHYDNLPANAGSSVRPYSLREAL